MTKTDYEIHRGLSIIWITLAVVALVFAVVSRAWHQLLVAGIAFVMFVASRPKKWVHIPDVIYDELNRQIEDGMALMTCNDKRFTFNAEEGDMDVAISVKISSRVTRSKFTDGAWGAVKKFTETNFYGYVEILGVSVTDAKGHELESDFDEDKIQVEYTSTEWN